MKKLILLFTLISGLAFAQMPNISNVWLNGSRPYSGTIGNSGENIRLKINISEQNKKDDQQYFVSGYSLVDKNYTKFEGTFTITKYKDSRKKGVVYGDYELAEEDKGKHSGTFRGKFTYTFHWNPKTEQVEGQSIELTGNWKSYDGTMDFKTYMKNQ
ncbi:MULTISPECIES: hypothetical protein [Chryseobacterium]|uniref:Uncharacterized protein n=1 Tax=Chryseobacterium camelliae TaxID=1265445 RepID=A0ABU0TJX7_9FLAO|nr:MULTISPECIES: hypothetical protein [Chryseobacterium]MDT3409532.1 hypothetical protein [Pseudacidovorax intermedius]MDQ1096605.1 hypothetical protein [Chryseobacterium camelliae]MDQ1100546.1 hypothetical protein [Chryseobacterium sp. SORGH_AS_1048]MDR6087887.1 hypothetical protein [Chryseobacterium sp. SORGH_AS_0909]MDR6132262.1 hypothetical protein [Chryseobacterium sp. SORGH_AS_1175]